MRTPFSLFGLLACLLAAPAVAGDVKLVSDTLDLVCKVEISWGPGAPNETEYEVHTDVHRDWSISKPGKLCYRRPSTPDNCDSGMTQWSTRWKCAESAGDAAEVLSLK